MYQHVPPKRRLESAQLYPIAEQLEVGMERQIHQVTHREYRDRLDCDADQSLIEAAMSDKQLSECNEPDR